MVTTTPFFSHFSNIYHRIGCATNVTLCPYFLVHHHVTVHLLTSFVSVFTSYSFNSNTAFNPVHPVSSAVNTYGLLVVTFSRSLSRPDPVSFSSDELMLLIPKRNRPIPPKSCNIDNISMILTNSSLRSEGTLYGYPRIYMPDV